MHVRLREKQSVISRAEVKATTQPHIPSGRRKCNSESHKSQFRNPQIILSFPLRRAGVKVKSWWHFPAGSIRIRHRPKQEPTNLGLNTDPHPSTSSSSLFSSSSSFGFPYFPPQFQSLIITYLLLKHGIISSYVHQDFYTHRLKSHH